MRGSRHGTTLVAMTKDDWFRGDAWDGVTRATFENNLNRARQSSRAQYLRIKGIGLTASIDGATREAGSCAEYSRTIPMTQCR
jgi:hypothetical protein